MSKKQRARSLAKDVRIASDQGNSLVWCRNGNCGMYGKLLTTWRTLCEWCRQELKAYDFQRDDPAMFDDGHALDREVMKWETSGGYHIKMLPASTEPQHNSNNGVLEFDSSCDAVTACSVAAKPSIHIPFDLYSRWVYLAKQFNVEWLAYLKGSADASNVVRVDVDGMYFPKQRAQGAHVVADPGVEMQESTIASIHSHVDMKAFFSNEDEAHFNHTADLVINRHGDIQGVVRVKLECGRFMRTLAAITLVGDMTSIGLKDQLESVLTRERDTMVVEKHWYDPRSGSSGTTYGPRRPSDQSYVHGRYDAKEGIKTYDIDEADKLIDWLKENGSGPRNHSS